MIKLTQFIVLFIITTTAFGISLDDVYIQEKGEIMSVQHAVALKNGKIMQKGDNYFLSVDGYQKSFDLKTDRNEINAVMGVVFPKHFRVELVFTNLYPNAHFYFDNRKLGITDNFGSATKNVYLEFPGSHTIKINKKKGFGFAKDDVKLNASCTVECADKASMKCNVTNSRRIKD